MTLPESITKFFSVKMAALIIGLWFISEADDWRTQLILGTITCVFIIGKNIQNCVESWCTNTREEVK